MYKNVDMAELLFDWRNKYENDYFAFDGIVNDSIWDTNSNLPRLLFILKEPNIETELFQATNGYQKIYDLRNHPINVKQSALEVISRWAYGIFSVHKSADHIPAYKSWEDEDIEQCWKKLAIVNIKKTNSLRGEADNNEIMNHAVCDKALITRQILLINPSVIICGHTFDALLSIFPDVKNHGCRPEQHGLYAYSFNGNDRKTLIIDYYHPSYYISPYLLYYAIVNIYRQYLLQKQNKNG